MASIINSYRFAAAAGGGGCDYVEATGGTITTSGDYKLHTFTSSGTFEVTCAGSTDDTVQYMVAAGGGGGGGTIGGGGGGGGLLTSTSYQVSAGKYEVIIGAGGAIGSATVQGSDGTLSSFGGMSPVEPSAAFTSTTNCKLLLHSDTTNGSTTFTDSTGNFSLSATGNAQHSTADQKFGASSILMDGTTDEVILSTSDTTMGGSSAHTVECWFNTSSSTAYQYLVCRNSSQQFAGLFIDPDHATNNIGWGGNATGTIMYATATINTGTWYHVAVVMDGTGAEIFFDGERVASVASFSAWGYATASGNITIGSQHYTGSSHRYTLDGYIDEVRWSDVARYSYSTAASAIGGGGGGCDGITSGRSGGSGGGGGETGSGSGTGGSGTVGQGNDGGDADGMNLSGGGGGGAGAAAYDVSGGDGDMSALDSNYYCGGGAGSSRYSYGSGGTGGGGDGAIYDMQDAVAGTANTGGGGGGGDSLNADPAAGGSGVVLVYYQFQGMGGP
jgi:hypothetical protein